MSANLTPVFQACRPRPSDQVVAQQEKRHEYDRQRSNTPERRESRRVRAREEQQKAIDLGLCVVRRKPAIPGQTRCEACSERHREYRRTSDAKRRATTE